MLLCEICGKEIRGRAYKILISGATLTVCKECSKYGTLIKTPTLKASKPAHRINIRRPRRIIKDSLFQEDIMLVEDYNIIIKRARESLGWTQDLLAARIGEKVSVIKRIEGGDMVPDLRLAKRLEKVLGVKLFERTPESTGLGAENVSRFELTLGDIVRLKHKKKSES